MSTAKKQMETEENKEVVSGEPLGAASCYAERIIKWCVENKLEPAHACDLHYNLRKLTETNKGEASSEILKKALENMDFDGVEDWILAF